MVVDCKKVFKAGQLGVGVGRVRTPDGLQILNFDKDKCPQHLPELASYYAEDRLLITPDLLCCHKDGE